MVQTSIDLLLNLKRNSKKVASVSSSDTALKAAKLLKKLNIGLLVVIDDDRLVGVISERDIVQRWVASDQMEKPLLVSDIMSEPVEVVTADYNIFDCYLRFVARNCRHLPVVDPLGSVIGVLSLRDVAHYVVGQLSETKKPKKRKPARRK